MLHESVTAEPRQELAGRPQQRARRKLPEVAALCVILVAMCAVFAVMSPYFLAVGNFISVLEATAVIGIVAIPGTMLLIAGQFDLSVGSATAFCGVVMATLISGHGPWVAVAAAIAAGLVVGLVNGTLVTVVGVNSLITTLGTLAVLRGVAQILADGQTVSVSDFAFLGAARPLLNIPVPVILFLLLILLAGLGMRFTVFGRSLYAVGANPLAARLTGVRSRRVLLLAFVASGLATALCGLVVTSQLGAASPTAGLGLELSVVTAIVLGGASLHGGRGTILGTFVGLMIIAVLNNGLVLLGISSFYQDIARGGLLILAVSFDQLRQHLQLRHH